MGPTNISLVKLFRADQALREVQERLDVATKNVRIQERKTHDLEEKLRAAHARTREMSAKSANLDLDLKSRDAQIEKLRTQQQGARNNKEYQTFLVEINTQKVDRGNVEEQALALLGELEKEQKETGNVAAALESEQQKLAQMKTQVGDTVAQLQAEIESLRGPREMAASTMSPKSREVFNRLADHHEGEALSALMKPDRRKEEYVCSACMMDLVTDVYNKLHTRDEIVFCPSCRRILYIPDDLPPELAVNKKKAQPSPAGESGEKSSPRARGKIGEILSAAQGESVKNAMDAGQNPHEFQLSVDGKIVGIYKGKSAENLERIIRFRMDEAAVTHELQVISLTESPITATSPDSTV